MTRTAPHRRLVLRQLSRARQRLDLPDGKFTAQELRYLRSLPAVAAVSAGRIRYVDAFKRECIRKYRAGESPARIFRAAGLDSALIGYKRIERCIARWRNIDVRPTPEHEAEDQAYLTAVARWRQVFTAQLARSIAADAASDVAQAAATGGSHVAVARPASSVPSTAAGKPAAGGPAVGAGNEATRLSRLARLHHPAQSGKPGEDLRDLLIAQQIRRIRELERKLERVRASCTCGACR